MKIFSKIDKLLFAFDRELYLNYKNLTFSSIHIKMVSIDVSAYGYYELQQHMWRNWPKLSCAQDPILLNALLSLFLSAFNHKNVVKIGREFSSPGRPAQFFSWVEVGDGTLLTSVNPYEVFEPLFSLNWTQEQSGLYWIPEFFHVR